MLLNCGVGEDSWESLGLQGTQGNQSWAFIGRTAGTQGNQSWVFIGRTDAETEAETLIPWPLDARSRLTREDSDAGKDWRQEEEEKTEDEMVG